MLERPKQDWEDHLLEYLVVEHTAKGMDEPELPKRGGCLPVLTVIVLILLRILL